MNLAVLLSLSQGFFEGPFLRQSPILSESVNDFSQIQFQIEIKSVHQKMICLPMLSSCLQGAVAFQPEIVLLLTKKIRVHFVKQKIPASEKANRFASLMNRSHTWVYSVKSKYTKRTKRELWLAAQRVLNLSLEAAKMLCFAGPASFVSQCSLASSAGCDVYFFFRCSTCSRQNIWQHWSNEKWQRR